MTTTTETTSPADLLATPHPTSPADVFAGRVLAAALGSLEITAIHLGERLGWYRAPAENGPLSPTELGVMSGTAERYAREWLEHQAASGYLDVHEVDGLCRGGLHPGAGAGQRYKMHPSCSRAL